MKINRTVSTVTIALLAVAGSGAAQTKKLTVKTGDAFNYTSKINVDQTVSMAGTETVNRGVLLSDPSLHVNSATKERIAWTLDPGQTHLMLENQMLPGGKIDTTIASQTTQFATDLKGTFTSPIADQQSIVSNMLGGASSLFNSWFSPTFTRDVKPGQSWDEKKVDSIVNGMVGIKMQTTSNVHYTYDGIVDTLGAKCMHIRARVGSMTMEGSGSFGGMKVAIDGDGTSTTDLYYTVHDGLMKAAALDMQTNLRMMINGEGDMVVPIAQRVNGTVLRK